MQTLSPEHWSPAPKGSSVSESMHNDIEPHSEDSTHRLAKKTSTFDNVVVHVSVNVLVVVQVVLVSVGLLESFVVLAFPVAFNSSLSTTSPTQTHTLFSKHRCAASMGSSVSKSTHADIGPHSKDSAHRLARKSPMLDVVVVVVVRVVLATVELLCGFVVLTLSVPFLPSLESTTRVQMQTLSPKHRCSTPKGSSVSESTHTDHGPHSGDSAHRLATKVPNSDCVVVQVLLAVVELLGNFVVLAFSVPFNSSESTDSSTQTHTLFPTQRSSEPKGSSVSKSMHFESAPHSTETVHRQAKKA